MSNFALRTVVGALLIAVALAATWLGGYVFATLAGLAAVMMFWEWRRIVDGWGIGWQAVGFLYAAVAALSLLWLRDRAPQGFETVMWVFLVTWATDIGAYLAGRAIGGPKLAPNISPNKTIAGLVGGMVSAGLAGWAWAEFTRLPLILAYLGPVMAIAAQGGDLFESWMKRKAGVKDSGTWLPGHGGALDRLDGLVVVATLTAGLHMAGMLS